MIKAGDIDVKVSMIRALISLGLEAVSENLQKEVMLFAGKCKVGTDTMATGFLNSVF